MISARVPSIRMRIIGFSWSGGGREVVWLDAVAVAVLSVVAGTSGGQDGHGAVLDGAEEARGGVVAMREVVGVEGRADAGGDLVDLGAVVVVAGMAREEVHGRGSGGGDVGVGLQV